jgi:FAD/FMN-containing dehydrogenase
MSTRSFRAPSRLLAQLNLALSKTSASSYAGFILQRTVTDNWRQLQILGRSCTPFGVKSGGHSINRGFSSTSGVQISLARFNTFNVNTKAQTVDLGPSLLWDDVYDRLDPYGVTVIGGRIPGVGVGGLTLGGGV